MYMWACAHHVPCIIACLARPGSYSSVLACYFLRLCFGQSHWVHLLCFRALHQTFALSCCTILHYPSVKLTQADQRLKAKQYSSLTPISRDGKNSHDFIYVQNDSVTQFPVWSVGPLLHVMLCAFWLAACLNAVLCDIWYTPYKITMLGVPLQVL